jgi:hypothetical protein
MAFKRFPFPRALGVGLLVALSLSVTHCAGSASSKARAEAAAASRVAVGSRDVLFVALPVLSDTASASLAALGWGDGRFQAELRKELAYQFERKKIKLTEDSAAAGAWLAVRLETYEAGQDPRYRGGAGLKTARGERQIAIRKPRPMFGGSERADLTVDHIREIARSLAAEARKSPAATAQTEAPPQMWLLF